MTGRRPAGRGSRPGSGPAVPGAERSQPGQAGRGGAGDSPRGSPRYGRDGSRGLRDPSGVSALLDRVGGRPIEVLVNNAGFGSYGPSAEADVEREDDEVAVDVSAVATLARAFLPGIIARRSGGFSTSPPRRSSPRRTRPCTGRTRHSCCRSARRCGRRPVRLGWRSPPCVRVPRARVSSTRWALIRTHGDLPRLADPEPVIEAGLRALDKGRAVVVPARGTRSSPRASGPCPASGSPSCPRGCSGRPGRRRGPPSWCTTRS